MTLSAHNLHWRLGGKIIIDGVSLTVQPGRVLGLLGPNGSGKSSLLRLLAGLRRPDQGQVTLDGTDLRRFKRRDLARRIALVEQQATTEANLRVRDVVNLGRTPHQSPFSGWQPGESEAVNQALAQVGMSERAERRWHSLSGGERQRAHIARALAQQPTELLLDEPTNHLDIHHQLELLQLIRHTPVTTIIALHDLNHALHFCDDLIVMDAGRIVAQGPAESVLDAALLRDVFKVEAQLHPSPCHDKPQIHFMPGQPPAIASGAQRA